MAEPKYAYILINTSYGGFGFSDTFKTEWVKLYSDVKDNDDDSMDDKWENLRDDERAIALVDKLGSNVASDGYARLAKRHIPTLFHKNKWYVVSDYDGLESFELNFKLAYENILDKMKLVSSDTPVSEFQTMYNEVKQMEMDWYNSKYDQVL